MTVVLVAVDETEESVHAAEVAHRLFGDDADYLAVSVAQVSVDPAGLPWWGPGWGVAYPQPYGAVWPYRSARSTRHDRAEATPEELAVATAADDARSAAEQAALPAEVVGDVGDPAAAILRTAEDRQVDVIVLGTRERGWFDRILHPSVSQEVLKQAAIPVLVVP